MLKCFTTLMTGACSVLNLLPTLVTNSIEKSFAGYVVPILKIESVDEPFDEASELMLKCLHYVLIIGVKNVELGLDDFWTGSTMPFDTVPNKVNLKVETQTNFELNQTFQRYGPEYKGLSTM